MNSPPPVCQYLDWDSQFFERRIARLQPDHLSDQIIAEAFAWCERQRIDCLYLLARSDDPATPQLAARNDFLFTDVRVTLEKTIDEQIASDASVEAVRLAREEDVTALRAIARTSHRDTRFYFDPHFERSKCDLLYETWVENSFRGFAQAVLVVEVDGRPAAYLTCHLKDNETQIGLVGVDQRQRGKGLGTRLVRRFLSWSREHGVGRATVVTQGRNIRAQRLYQNNGFTSASMQLWYHRWFTR